MSFAGTVYDMIARGKLNRDLLNLRRDRAKNGRNVHVGKGNAPKNVTAEQMGHIIKEIREREEREQHYTTRMTLIIASAIVASIMVMYFVIFFLF